MLGKILIFTFCFVGMFGLLTTYMPTEFSPVAQDALIGKIRTEFSAANVLVYNQTVHDNMTYPYEKDWDYGLPPPQKLRIEWQEITGRGYPYPKGIWLTHLTDNLWGWWYGYHILEMTYRNGTKMPMEDTFIQKADMIAAWEPENEWSIFYAYCTNGHISSSIVFQRNDTSKTIGENWDAGTISYKMTYDVDLSKSGYSAWTVVATLLSFVFPTVNIAGIGGIIINGAIGAVMTIMITYTLYKLITGLIPLVSGGSGD